MIADVTMQWLMDDSIDRQAGMSLAKMTVEAGAISERHFHPNCSEIIHVLRGEIKQYLGDEIQVMRAGDTVLIPPNTAHQTENIGKDAAVMMVSYSMGRRVYIKA